MYVHLSVADYSIKFLQKWRRVNHVTPKNYLDFINSYTDLLKQKDKFFLDQVCYTIYVDSVAYTCMYVCVRMHICMYLCIYVCTYICAYVCMCVHMYVQM